MMNGKDCIYLQRFFICLSVLGGIFLFPVLSGAGNKQYVEKQVKNLDDLNKEIVRGFPNIPQNGVITYKAIITEGNKNSQVKIIEKKIEMIPGPTAEKPPIEKVENLLKNK